MSGDDSLIEMYQDIILKHNKTPQRKHPPEAGWLVVDGRNTSCGDEVVLGVAVSDEGVVEDGCFDGASCAICTASASMMVEDVIGRAIDEVRERSQNIQDSLTGETQIDSSEGDLAALNGVRRFPVRLKCASLPWEVLDKALVQS